MTWIRDGLMMAFGNGRLLLTKGIVDRLENKEVVLLENDGDNEDCEKEEEDEDEEVITKEFYVWCWYHIMDMAENEAIEGRYPAFPCCKTLFFFIKFLFKLELEPTLEIS